MITKLDIVIIVALGALASCGVSNLRQQTKDYESIRVERTIQGKSIKNWVTQEVKVYSKEDLKKKLTKEEYRITQEDGTERAGTSPLDKNYMKGIYVDIISGEPLYLSIHKYDSGTGWPSFTQAIEENINRNTDYNLVFPRTEIRSKEADSHLGHVFDDGPKEKGGKRFCMNGNALKFIPLSEMEAKGYGKFITQLEEK